MGLAFESQRNHIKKAVSSEGTAFFMEIFKKDLSISGAMEKILSISINLSRWIVKGFLPVYSISIAFGVISISFGVNSKALGDNSKGLRR